MSASSKSAVEAVVQPPPVEKPPFAVFFQFEDIMVNGRKAAFEALKKVFSKAKKEMTPVLFARYCQTLTPAAYLPQLAEALHTASSEKMLADFNDSFAAALAAAPTDSGFVKLLEAAHAKHFAVVAFTGLPETLAASIGSRLGLDELGVKIVPFQNGDKVFPGPTTLLKMARTVELRPRCCLVVTAAMGVCKAALSADMQCVVVPDEFTDHQDFSGSNMLLEGLSELAPDKLFSAVFPAQSK